MRQNYYSRDIIEKLLYVSDIVKINRDEFEQLRAFGLCKNESELCRHYNIEKLLSESQVYKFTGDISYEKVAMCEPVVC